MSDNKLSRFSSSSVPSVPSVSSVSSVPSVPSSTLSNKSKSLTVSPIDKFYDNRKNLYDICGNVINKEKYAFINILSTYLIDIVNSIDIEINKSTRNSMINWREKKNPKLLSKFINSDDNINIINRSMNKITSSNYMTIALEISDTLMQDNFRKLPEYSKFLFDTIIKKCLNDEKFATDYLHFLVAFDGNIGKNINNYVNEFITEAFDLLKNNNGFKCNDDSSYFSYIKDVNQYINIGIILANLYLIKNESKESNTNSNINMYLIFSESVFYEKLICCLNHINNYIEWLPSNINELIGRINLLFGILEIVGLKLLNIITENDRNLLNDILMLIYNVNTIPNKIKFKVLDIQDMIKSFIKSKQIPIKPINNNHNHNQNPIYKSIDTIVEEKVEEPVEEPVEEKVILPIEKPKQNKQINYSSLKLVQMKSINTENDFVPKVEVPKVEVPKVEVPKVEVPKVELITKDGNNRNHHRNNRNNRNKDSNRNKDINRTENKNTVQSNKITNNNNNNNNIVPNSTIKTNDDDDGFIKIEKKPRIINNEFQNSSNKKNNFKQKNKPTN